MACDRVGALTTKVHAQVILKEVTITTITPTPTSLGQITGREYSPAHQQKIGLKIYWAWPHPSEEDPVSPTVSLSHQEATIATYPYLSEGKQNESTFTEN